MEAIIQEISTFLQKGRAKNVKTLVQLSLIHISYLFFVLASADHSEHIDNMQKLAQMLLTPGATEKLMEVKSKEDLIRLDEELS